MNKTKNGTEDKPELINSYFEHQTIFINVVTQLLDIIPSDAKDKLSADSPLGNFINTINYKNFNVITYLNPQKISESAEIHFFYRPNCSRTKFTQTQTPIVTIIETLCATPNTRDEENYFNWHPFKSKIICYVDFNEQFFNILMKVENGRITILVRDDSQPEYPFDQELVEAVMSNFKNVLVPTQFR